MPSNLSSKDFRRVLDGVQLLHGCGETAELPSTMRRAAELLVPGDIIAYSEFDLTSLAPSPETEPDLDGIAGILELTPLVTTDDPSTERDINRVVPWMVQFAEEHPLFRLALNEPDPPVAKISDFLSLPGLRDLGLYRQFFQPLKVTRQIALCPTRCEGLVTGLTVNRSGRDFSERDRTCLSLLTPHLRNAYREIWWRANLQEQFDRQMHQLEELPTAIVGLAADGSRIEFATRVGRSALAACFSGFNGRNLPEPLKSWVSEIRKRIGSIDDPSAVNTSKSFPTENGILWVKLVETSDRVHLILRQNDEESIATRLVALGLTKREAEVLACLREGGTNRQIARRLFVSPGTIRTHVERILSKLGAPTRTAAVRLADEFLRQSDWD